MPRTAPGKARSFRADRRRERQDATHGRLAYRLPPTSVFVKGKARKAQTDAPNRKVAQSPTRRRVASHFYVAQPPVYNAGMDVEVIPKLTYEEFRQLPDDGKRYELIHWGIDGLTDFRIDGLGD